MKLKNIKDGVVAAYLLAVGGVAVVSGVTSGAGLVAFGALALLPAGALLALWNDPPQTMSETIQTARR
jgi:hypothetical protein